MYNYIIYTSVKNYSHDYSCIIMIYTISILYYYIMLSSQHDIAFLATVDPHLFEHLGTEGWSDMRNVQITETGLNVL